MRIPYKIRVWKNEGRRNLKRFGLVGRIVLRWIREMVSL
jgi:hypothetical protein